MSRAFRPGKTYTIAGETWRYVGEGLARHEETGVEVRRVGARDNWEIFTPLLTGGFAVAARGRGMTDAAGFAAWGVIGRVRARQSYDFEVAMAEEERRQDPRRWRREGEPRMVITPVQFRAACAALAEHSADDVHGGMRAALAALDVKVAGL
jgi:hypothetical protein